MFSKFFKKNKNVLDSRNKNDLLHNVYVLYIVFIIAVLDIFYILQIGDFYSATVFVAVGLLISLISKNMIVILCIAMIVTHIFKFGEYSVLRKKEGFETDIEEETNEPIVEKSVSDEIALDAENEELLNEEYKEEFEPYEEESEESDFHLEKEKNKKDKKEMSENKVKELIEKQNVILDKLNTMKPFLSTMKNWFGGSESKNTESNEE